MINTILIFLGAGVGGVSRYWVSSTAFLLFGRSFPYGTLIVNVTSSFFMGLLFALLLERFYDAAPQLRSLLLIGFLGGFSTFSALSIETLNLYENGAVLAALINIFANIVLCLIAVWFGVMGARQL